MKLESTETEEEIPETVEDLLDDEEGEPEYEPDFDEKLAIRQYAFEAAMDYWTAKVGLSQNTGDPNRFVEYPAHISTILDTAHYIELFQNGDFKSGK